MKISKLWLREWVNFSLTEQELASQLTMAGLEVDAVSPVAGAFTNVIVAEVLNTKPHPDASKLTLCEVNVNADKPLSIVCGAANVRPGLKVALAMIGAALPGGIHIKESKLRGELSQGMLCSVTELGLEEQSEGILELAQDAPVGMDLREYLQLDDSILDVDLTPNRADCFSMLGVAREVAVLNKIPLNQPEITAVTPVIDDVLAIHLQNPAACPNYCGRIIRSIDSSATTPLWMSERLRRGGIRAVHPVVDVLNYVMLELGQPMHAFDLETLESNINVRFATADECLTLLDGQEVTLSEKVLVIADAKKPLAIAGIMGGEASSVQPHTKDIFLESAYFNPITIAGVARIYGLSSDSSQRFERGVDYKLQLKALERATALILSITGGKAGPVIEVTDKQHVPSEAVFTFDTDKVKRLTGVAIPVAEMKDLLQGLGIAIVEEKNALLTVKAPSHRFDIQQDVDLVEEIIRLYGYDTLEAQSMQGVIRVGTTNSIERIATEIALWFRDRGYNETISYSFVDPELQEALYPQKEFMQLLNPISSELSQMRLGMWPGLLASMIYNVHRQQNTIKFFEIGVVFDVHNKQLQERSCVAGLLMGEKGSMNWSEAARSYDFFDLKGELQALFSCLKIPSVEFVPAVNEALHPGQAAQIKINDKLAGWIGVVHPKLADALDIQQEAILFEIDLATVVTSTTARYKTISKYPKIRRDLSLLVDEQISALQIEQAVRKCIKQDWLKSFEVFDVYKGVGIPEGKKSLAIAMTLQDDKRTLVDSEINSLISAIIEMLQNEFSIILRE